MKKNILILSIALAVASCSKVKDGEYAISGTAKGIENGKTIILETPSENGMGLVAKDTVKVENEKFEMKGTITDPSFYTIQVEGSPEKVPFILESGEEVVIEIYKDSVRKSKISGTYNNEEFVKFTEEMSQSEKSLTDFQKKNTPLMLIAQQKKDSATINKLMEEFIKIQEEVGTKLRDKSLKYAETHPKSFISMLIVQQMVQDPNSDTKKVETIYNGLEDYLKNSKIGKQLKQAIAAKSNPTTQNPAFGNSK